MDTSDHGKSPKPNPTISHYLPTIMPIAMLLDAADNCSYPKPSLIVVSYWLALF